MARRLISTDSIFEERIGYSRVVVDGDWVFVSGCTGFDYETNTISDDVAEQTHQVFRNITEALEKAGSRLEDVVQSRVIVAERVDFETVTPVLRSYFRDIRPTNTTFICGLADPRMKVEIEVTARKRADEQAL